MVMKKVGDIMPAAPILDFAILARTALLPRHYRIPLVQVSILQTRGKAHALSTEAYLKKAEPAVVVRRVLSLKDDLGCQRCRQLVRLEALRCPAWRELAHHYLIHHDIEATGTLMSFP